MKTNPYIAGNPVGGGEAFIGRADVLRDVLRVLKSPHENGMVLYGQRRIGKTSVLQELTASLPQKGPYAPVYFDLQDKAALPLDQVLRQLAEQISYKLEISPLDNLNDDFPTAFQKEFLPYVLSKLPEETALVLLFDEFDVLESPKQKQAVSAFFPYLRDLMAIDTKRMKFVFVIGRRPEDLSSVYLSLFKGVKSRHVSLLSPEDTTELVRISETNESLKWPDDVSAKVYNLTGGHTYLTQQLCQVVWDNIYDNDPEDMPIVQPNDAEQAVPKVIESAKSSLEWLWDGLGPAERVVASALAEAGPKIISQDELGKYLQESGVRILIGELQDAPSVLAEWDLIQPEKDGYRIRVEILRRWIAERKPLSRVQDEIDRILPVADNLFQAAYGLYQGGSLDEAIPLLQQAVGLNPNHLKANQLLAEILLAQGNREEALRLLETLYEYNPLAARPRLIQALLSKAKEEKQESDQLILYENILELEPNQPEAIAELQNLWKKQGNAALRNNEIGKAFEAYKKAYKHNSSELQPRFIQALINQAKQEKREDKKIIFYEKILELDSNQPEAVAEYRGFWEKQGDIAFKNDRLDEALEFYSKANAKIKIENVEKRLQLNTIYLQSIDILNKNKDKAQRLLTEVISMEPSFKEATRYLHLVVTGVDILELENKVMVTGKNLEATKMKCSGLEKKISGLEYVKLDLQKRINILESEKENIIRRLNKEKPKSKNTIPIDIDKIKHSHIRMLFVCFMIWLPVAGIGYYYLYDILTKNTVIQFISLFCWMSALLSTFFLTQFVLKNRRIKNETREKEYSELKEIGPYKLVKKIGTGGMAEVYLTDHVIGKNITRTVALKKVLPSLIENDDLINMFKQEAKLSMKLDHPNIVRTTDFREEYYSIIMEYIDGGHLTEIMKAYQNYHPNKGLPFEQAIFIILNICMGLQYVHSLDIIHRDICPQSIMISFKGEVKIADFGIAKGFLEPSLTQAGIVKGKYYYISPEQAMGKKDIDYQSDIYSLGIIFYELLSGRQMYSYKTAIEAIRNIPAKAFPPVKGVMTNIPEETSILDELDRIVMKCLEKDKKMRYKATGEILTNLKELRQNFSIPPYGIEDLEAFMEKYFRKSKGNSFNNIN
ncbi:MAG: protein kinase [Desulfobacterales bacterium]|nr:protein kinase [Desulfobacterales bacterium]